MQKDCKWKPNKPITWWLWHDNEIFQIEVTTDDLKNVILKLSKIKSSDTDDLDVTMITNSDTKVLLFLLTIFNACWEYHVWPRMESRVVSKREPNEERSDEKRRKTL